MKATGRSISIIKSFEGCKLESYQDAGGVWTIGWGQTGRNIGPGLRITQLEADQFLQNHVGEVERQISSLVSAPLSQNQFDALVSFVYNVGAGAFASSTLLKKLNRQDYSGAASELLRWNKDDGKLSHGLVNRRFEEHRMFSS